MQARGKNFQETAQRSQMGFHLQPLRTMREIGWSGETYLHKRAGIAFLFSRVAFSDDQIGAPAKIYAPACNERACARMILLGLSFGTDARMRPAYRAFGDLRRSASSPCPECGVSLAAAEAIPRSPTGPDRGCSGLLPEAFTAVQVVPTPALSSGAERRQGRHPDSSCRTTQNSIFVALST